MQHLPKEELAGELGGTRIGIVGFPTVQANEMAALVQSAGCVSTHLSSETAGGTFETFDALLVCPVDDARPTWIMGLLATPQPWLFIGDVDVIHRNVILHLRADEVVFQPYSLDEVLFRLYRAIRRRALKVLQPPRQHTCKVLVADDDPNILALLKSTLVSQGVESHFANNGREALAMVRDLLPDVLVLDIEMPSMNGLEVLRAIRQDPATKNIKVVLLTGSRDLHAIEAGSSLGADAYFGKPFSHLLLTGRIKQFFSESNRALQGAAEGDHGRVAARDRT
jgi:two-component system alkaline phosphatase synthesis response regulator PhoP